MLILIIGAVFMMAISIFIHELGHLICGWLVGVQAKIFSIGYGKGIWKKRIGGTVYQVTAIPIGGYVLFKGDQYGKGLKGRKGELLSTPPLKRMIPVLGGPVFNLFLAFILLFIIEFFGDSPAGNKIFIDPSSQNFSPSYNAGLRTGDKILDINSSKIEYFEDLFSAVALSEGKVLNVRYERNGDVKELNIVPKILSNGGRPTIGVEPFGERRVVVTFTYIEQFRNTLNKFLDSDQSSMNYFNKKYANELSSENKLEKNNELNLDTNLSSRAIDYLNDGDEIISVNGITVNTIGELQRVLGGFQNEKVQIEVNRKVYPLLNPWTNKKEIVSVPVRPAFQVEFSNLKDEKFSEFNQDQFTLVSYDPEISDSLQKIRVNGKKFQRFDELKKYLQSEKEVKLKIGQLTYTANTSIISIGLLGFKPSMKFIPEKIPNDPTILSALVASSSKIGQSVYTTLKGLGLLFTGFLSPSENLSGPVGIIQYAGISLEYGWYTYFDFIARISIALMIMNLLPIPMADGGHLVLYAYEAITGKPLPAKVIENIFKFGFVLLLGLGLFVTFNDVMRIF